MVFSSFIKNPTRTRYDGQDSGEQVKYVLRRSFITNGRWITITILMFFAPLIFSLMSPLFTDGQKLFSGGFLVCLHLFWYVATFGFFFLNFLLWFFNVYIITNKKILDIDFMGLLYKNISEATIDNIEDVTSQVKGAFGVIFNIGDVYVQTAAEIREFEFTGVENPSGVRDLIADFVSETRNRVPHGRKEILLRED